MYYVELIYTTHMGGMNVGAVINSTWILSVSYSDALTFD